MNNALDGEYYDDEYGDEYGSGIIFINKNAQACNLVQWSQVFINFSVPNMIIWILTSESINTNIEN